MAELSETGKSIFDRAIDKQDKLAYKNSIQSIVEGCLVNQHDTCLKDWVDALEHSLYFNIDGLPLADLIDEFNSELKEFIDDWIPKAILNYDDRVYYHPRVMEDLCNRDRDELEHRIYFTKYQSKMTFLIKMLAKHSALLRSSQYVQEGSK